jgi:hypothetical protein
VGLLFVLGVLLLATVPNAAGPLGRAVSAGTTPPPRAEGVGCAAGRAAPCATHRASGANASAGAGTLFAWDELSELLPTNTSDAGLAIDPALSEAVEFGGETLTGLTNTTQLYNESSDSWITVSDGGPPPPSARSDFGFAGDAATGTAVLFGGNVGSASAIDTNDTWVFNFTSATWRNVSAEVAPAPREDPAFAIDPSADTALLFGGWDPDYEGSGQVTFSDTWELNLTTYVWTRVPVDASSAPPALFGAGLDWDAQSNTFDLFGGCYPCSNAVWQFDLSDGGWTQPTPPNGPLPTPRMLAVWVYDPDLDGDILFGGTNGISVVGDLLVYLPSDHTWAAESTPSSPPPRAAAAAGWLEVPGNATLLMTGGADGNQTYPGTWRMGLTGAVVVVVENGTSETPVTDALVATNLGGSLPTNAEGAAQFLGLPSAELVVNVTAPGYAPATASQWVMSGFTSTLIVDLRWVPPATVDTQVVEAGAPVNGALVNLTIENVQVGASLLTDVDGWSNTTGVPAFAGVVTAWAPGQHANSTHVDFVSGQVTVVTLSLLPLLELEVDVEGQLANGSLSPLLNATVTVNDLPFGMTDRTGHLAAATSYTGREIVAASAPYFAPNSTVANLPLTGILSVTLILTSAPPGYLDVTLLNTQTQVLVPNAVLNFTQTPALPVGPASFERLVPTGTLLITLLAGNYSLTASAPGYTVNRGIPLQWIRPGQIDPLTVLLSPLPRATVDTLILDNTTHRPISRANVTLEGYGNLTSNAEGWANFTSLEANGYTLVVSAVGYDTNVTGLVLNPGQVLPRFPVNLTPAGSPTGPGGTNDLSLLAPTAGSLWALLLLPLGALALAVLYLTMLRVPASGSNGGAAPSAPPTPPRRRRGLGRRPAAPSPEPPR